MKTNPTRAVDLKFQDGSLIGKLVWAWGECTILTTVESRREPRLDTDNPLAIDQFIWAIQHGDPSGTLEFLWDDYLNAGDRAS